MTSPIDRMTKAKELEWGLPMESRKRRNAMPIER